MSRHALRDATAGAFRGQLPIRDPSASRVPPPVRPVHPERDLDLLRRVRDGLERLDTEGRQP